MHKKKLFKLSIYTYKQIILFFPRRKPDLDVDPENIKVRENTTNDDVDLDNRFGEGEGNKPMMKCGMPTIDNRIVGGELCEIDK